VNVSEVLDVTLYGNGTVNYLGEPQVRRSGSGKGRVNKLRAPGR
jgi:hypothetical protein